MKKSLLFGRWSATLGSVRFRDLDYSSMSGPRYTRPGGTVRHRAISLLGSFVVLIAAFSWTGADISHVEAAHLDAAAQPESSRYAASDPLPTYTFVPPSSNGQPVR